MVDVVRYDDGEWGSMCGCGCGVVMVDVMCCGYGSGGLCVDVGVTMVDMGR